MVEGEDRIATATVPTDMHHRHGFFKFYWTCSKHFGSKVWETKGAEFVSALVLTIVILAVSWMLGQKDANTAFEIGTISLGGWLAVFAMGHLIRTPVLFHQKEVEAKALAANWIFGVIGILVAVLIVSSLVGVGWWMYAEHERPTTLPSADLGVLRPLIEKQRQEISDLKARVCDEKSLKSRSPHNPEVPVELVDLDSGELVSVQNNKEENIFVMDLQAKQAMGTQTWPLNITIAPHKIEKVSLAMNRDNESLTRTADDWIENYQKAATSFGQNCLIFRYFSPHDSALEMIRNFYENHKIKNADTEVDGVLHYRTMRSAKKLSESVKLVVSLERGRTCTPAK